MLPEGKAYSPRFVRRPFVHHGLIIYFPNGEHIVAALSVRQSFLPSFRPSHFCPEPVSKCTQDNLMKIDKLIKGHQGNYWKKQS